MGKATHVMSRIFGAAVLAVALVVFFSVVVMVAIPVSALIGAARGAWRGVCLVTDWVRRLFDAEMRRDIKLAFTLRGN